MIRIFTDNTQDKIEVTDALEKLIKSVAEGVLEFEEIDEKCNNVCRMTIMSDDYKK